MSWNQEPKHEASALVLLFLVLLLLGFEITSWLDREAAKDMKRFDYLEQFAPQAHLDSEAEEHRTPIKYSPY
jgi:hypothetical protein